MPENKPPIPENKGPLIIELLKNYFPDGATLAQIRNRLNLSFNVSVEDWNECKRILEIKQNSREIIRLDSLLYMIRDERIKIEVRPQGIRPHENEGRIRQAFRAYDVFITPILKTLSSIALLILAKTYWDGLMQVIDEKK